MWEFLKALAAWLKDHESLAIWLEGVALVAIFFLDWRERKDQRKERQKQHEETASQFLVSQKQVEAVIKSADAATEAALAAKKSAEISAALHRPFVGLSNVSLKTGWGTRLWDISFSLKNSGTLPAVNVGLSADFYTDDSLRLQTKESPSVQLFPSSELVSIVRFDMGEPDRPEVHAERKKLRIDVRIRYQGELGGHFEYAAAISYTQNRFDIARSETRLLPPSTTSPFLFVGSK
jgi:hypothetical protein